MNENIKHYVDGDAELTEDQVNFIIENKLPHIVMSTGKTANFGGVHESTKKIVSFEVYPEHVNQYKELFV